MEQLQHWLDGDPVDHLSTPLFIPSSTLLSMPTAIRHAPAAKTQDAALTQVWPHSVILIFKLYNRIYSSVVLNKKGVVISSMWLLVIMHFELFWLSRSQSLMICQTQQAGLKPCLYRSHGDWRNWSDRFWRAKKKSWPADWSSVVCWALLMTDEGNSFNKWLCSFANVWNRPSAYCKRLLGFIYWPDGNLWHIKFTPLWLSHLSVCWGQIHWLQQCASFFLFALRSGFVR